MNKNNSHRFTVYKEKKKQNRDRDVIGKYEYRKRFIYYVLVHTDFIIHILLDEKLN